MKIKCRIRIPHSNLPVDEQDRLLYTIKDSFNQLGITSTWYVDDEQADLPAYIELNVPGNNKGSIELLKLKTYIF